MDSRDLLVLAVLAGATIAVYAPVWSFGFVNLDDPAYAADNEMVRAGWTLRGVFWAFGIHEANWHPLTWLSLMLDAEIGGGRPSVFHVTSLALHLLAACMLFAVLRRLTGARWKSAFVAAAFSLHPLHVESVAWIAERKEVLSALFGFAALWAYARHAERPTGGRLALVAACLALSLMAKPMWVTLPLVVLLLDVWPLRRLAIRGGHPATGAPAFTRLLAEKIPLFAMSLASGAVTLAAQHSGGAMRTFEEIPLWARLSNAVVACAAYLGKTIWPVGLAVYYPYPSGGHPPSAILGAAGLLILLTAAALWAGRTKGYWFTGWLWYLVTLLPVVGVVQVGRQAMADRYTYVPLVGIFVAVAWGAEALLVPGPASARSTGASSSTRRGAVLAAALAATALGVRSRDQVWTWRDSGSLMEHALRATTDNALAHNNLGTELHAAGRWLEAAAHWREALRITPEYPDARANLAGVLIRQGQVEEGIASCLEALRLEADHPGALSNLGFGLMRQGKLDEAVSKLRDSLRVRPRHAGTHLNLGTALALRGDVGAGIAEYGEALRLDSNLVEAHLNRATLLVRERRVAEATADFEAAIRIDPNNEAARQGLDRLRRGAGATPIPSGPH